jgi:hypothetical protein
VTVPPDVSGADVINFDDAETLASRETESSRIAAYREGQCGDTVWSST